MAIKSTIFKAALHMADIDHGHYAEHTVTLARHPSETDERMMVRLVALALNAHTVQSICQGNGAITFGQGMSNPDDPDVVLTDYTGRKRLWIEVGQPEEKPVVRAASQTDALRIYAYGPSADLWWKAIEPRLARIDKLQVWRLPSEQAQALSPLAERSMQLHATVQEGELTLSSERGSVALTLTQWK
jgi:uncharacterized protein YaeQ